MTCLNQQTQPNKTLCRWQYNLQVHTYTNWLSKASRSSRSSDSVRTGLANGISSRQMQHTQSLPTNNLKILITIPSIVSYNQKPTKLKFFFRYQDKPNELNRRIEVVSTRLNNKHNCTMLYLFDDLWLDKIIPKNNDRTKKAEPYLEI